ncbi:MAG TPA: alanine racemase [Acidimicrobiales bacterium]|nr:alanine racemase [Acidimicrobiales bacterium]
MNVHDVPTPALVVDADALEHNLAAMAAARPGPSLRPHVKAHKCTRLAAEQAARGHAAFTCATPREALGMARAGLGEDLLIANEVLDAGRLEALVGVVEAGEARITVAVDSEATVAAAAAAGLLDVLIDVDVGLPRCGSAPDAAGALADLARSRGLNVRGVMGYEGHLMMVADRERQRDDVANAMDKLIAAHDAVGGEIVSAGGTGTYDLHDRVTEVQAGSYALMDTQYATLGLPFRAALFVDATVISVRPDWAVCDAGLKAFGMDHGNPALLGGTVWYCSDEHTTFAPDDGSAVAPGDRVRLQPAHVDPTVAYHERMHLVRGDEVVDVWEVDLRGW